MKSMSIVLLAVIMAGMLGCNGPKADVALDPSMIRYPGFETFPTPRDFDGPGTVFRIDKQGKQHFVEKLNVNITGPHSETLARPTNVSSVSLEGVARMMGKPGAFHDVDASVQAGRMVLLSVDLGQGGRYRTSEGELDDALKNLKIEFKPNNRYFVIRQVIAISKIEYIFADWVTADARIRGTLDKIAEGSASFDWKDLATRQMSQKFPKPQFLFFLPDEVFPPAPGVLEGPGSTPTRAPIDLTKHRVIWSSEARR